MVEYYRTKAGLYYKQYKNGTSIRIPRKEYLEKVKSGGKLVKTATRKCRQSRKKNKTCSRKTSRKRSRKRTRKTSRKRSRKSTRKTSRKRSRKVGRKSKSLTKKQCQQLVSDKIKENMEEFYHGKFSSRAQVIAVSYSQVRKANPGCHPFIR